MADPKLLDQTVLSGELRSIASAPELTSRRAELDALADALDGDGPVEPWTELDLVAGYARPESLTRVDSEPGTKWLAGAEIALGVIVFLPLLITWFGLVQASNAYGELISSDPGQAERPFLQLWQSGFGGRLPGWLTFGSVATDATILIAGLLLISGLHAAKRGRVSARAAAAEERGEHLLGVLVPLLTRIQLVLNSHRLSSPQRFTAELTSASRRLGKLTSQALEAHDKLSEAAESISETTTEVRKHLDRVDRSVAPLTKAVERVEKVVRENAEQGALTAAALSAVGTDTGAGLEKLAEAVGDELQRIGARVEGVVRENAQQLAGVNADTGAGLEKLAEVVGGQLWQASERVEEALSDLSAAQRGFTTGTELVADVTGQVLDALHESASRLSDVAVDVRRGADLVSGSAAQFAAGVTTLQSLGTVQLPVEDAVRSESLLDVSPGVDFQKKQAS
ncbi:methyl-accepting chemotaxis protein [Streptomyces sp. NPDC002120]|uniref:methyl-accepting chemotaxis protein n=1 Tax=Streptomyces sp. NPDC002120 TaxID=3364631 RepID=UPI0036B12A3D